VKTNQLIPDEPAHRKLCEEILDRSMGWIPESQYEETLTELLNIPALELSKLEKELHIFLGWPPRSYEILGSYHYHLSCKR
jgi:hypothetical protein